MKSINRAWGRWVEWFLLFVATPIVAYMDWLVVSKFAIFAAPVAYALWVYFMSGRESAGSLRSLFARGAPPQLDAAHSDTFEPTKGRRVPERWLLRTAIGVSAVFVFAWWAYPDSFLDLPRRRTELWILICLFYPWLSALPQEFLYRSFYFERYRGLFGSGRWLTVTNVLCFAGLHLMYDNVVAIVMTLIGGLLFAQTYRSTLSLRWVAIEHALYGLAIFTSGLGQFFYEPIGG